MPFITGDLCRPSALVYLAWLTQGSQSLALGLTLNAASQLVEGSRPGSNSFYWTEKDKTDFRYVASATRLLSIPSLLPYIHKSVQPIHVKTILLHRSPAR